MIGLQTFAQFNCVSLGRNINDQGQDNSSKTVGIAGLIAFAVLCFADVAFFFYIQGIWQACVSQVYRHRISNRICLFCVSGSYFGNSHSISDFALLFYVLGSSVISEL